MRANQSGVIVGNIGMMVIGFFVAGAVATAAAHLWHAMQLPVLVAAFLGWILGGTAVILRDCGKREIEPPSLSRGREYTYFSRTNTVLVAVSGTLFGFVLASLLAGLVGLLFPEVRWPVLLVVLGVSVTAGLIVILRGVFGIDLRNNI
jgi:Na+(H+)/acetate symporter ActP